MKRNVILLAMVCFFFFIGQINTHSCWVGYEIDEMEEKSDLVVIGKYNGNMREHVDDNGCGHSYWTIDVEQVLKGSEHKSIEVVTGGSSNAKVFISTDYRLIDIAKGYMLLYLSESDNAILRPITPSGIVGLEYEEGGHLLGTYNIKSEQHTGEYNEIIESVERMNRSKIGKAPIQKEDVEEIMYIGYDDESNYTSKDVEQNNVNGTQKVIISSIVGIGLIGVIFKKYKK